MKKLIYNRLTECQSGSSSTLCEDMGFYVWMCGCVHHQGHNNNKEEEGG